MRTAISRILVVIGLLVLGWCFWFVVTDLIPTRQDSVGKDDFVSFNLGLTFLLYFSLPVAALLLVGGLILDVPRRLRALPGWSLYVVAALCLAGAVAALGGPALRVVFDPVFILIGVPRIALAVLLFVGGLQLLRRLRSPRSAAGLEPEFQATIKAGKECHEAAGEA